MMLEILITSTALIFALLLIRRVFRETLSRRVQYALWGLVLVRLLIPVQLFGLPVANFSVLTATKPVEQAVLQQVNRQVYYSRPVERMSPEELLKQNILVSEVPTAEEGAAMILMEPPTPGSPISFQQRGYLVRDAETNAVTLYEHMAVGPWEILSNLWKSGMAVMALFFLGSNLIFWQRLRKVRREFTPEDGPARKVYLVPDGVLPSPCLFGNSIYLTPAAIETPDKLRHVLMHEETHARHLDPLWSLLRCLCLTVYWFDPLVWVAAACSKTDCELACDESVLEALGEAERVPYGQTLLSLIPVKRASNPMIAATTMTAGKKQLKERVTRIAKGSRQMAAAVLAVAVLASVTAACTFTGAKPTGAVTPSPTESQQPQGPRALTGEELRWFNEEYFNRDPNPAISYIYTIRNQFINGAFNLYDKPEDIDLYQLFYCEGSILTAEEHMTVFEIESPDGLACPAYKMTAQEMDDVLREYTGLTLAQTNMVGLEHFIYQNDAYYWMHGDTNYPGDIEILSGTREGDTVKLYHHGWNSGSEWCETTLSRQPDGGYWFVSNRECEKPSIPTPLPAWEPVATVDLSVLEPYTAPAVTVEAHRGDFDGSYENRLENWNFDGHNVVIYRATDGHIHAAIRQADDTMNVFLTIPSDDCNMFFYHDLLGHDGFYIRHAGEDGNSVYDYFYINQDAVPVRLLTAPFSDNGQIDLNGDGSDELLSNKGFFFQREGHIYEVRFAGLEEHWPGQVDHISLNRYGKYYTLRGYTGDYKDWIRYLYFDGENLLIYKNEKPTTDHMVVGADENVPAAVVEEAKDFVSEVYLTAEKERLEADSEKKMDSQDVMSLPEYDDWRVDYFAGPYVYSYGGATVEGWWFNYELHTTTPEDVVLAGGRYLTEDDWVSPGYPGCDALFFEVKDGSYRLLHSGMYQESPESYYMSEQVLQMMEEGGVELTDGATYAKLWFQKRLEHLTDPHGMRIQYADGKGNGGAYLIDPTEGNGNYYMGQMKDNYVVWSQVEGPETLPEGSTVTLSSPDWYDVLQFWQDSDLVMFKEQNREPEWYQVTYGGDPAQDVFAYRAVPYYWARSWFDEAQWATLTASIAAIPSAGQSRQAIAQTWIEAHEGVMTRLFPGGSMTCSYVKVADVRILEDMPESWFPKETSDHERFTFRYTVIFVPENEDALNTLMAGNTGEYNGNDPDVPQGAYEYSRTGSMYLSEEDNVWLCAGVGTG